MKTLKDLKAQLLANPAIAAEYEAQAEEFAAARADIGIWDSQHLEQLAQEWRTTLNPCFIGEQAQESVLSLMFGYEKSTGKHLTDFLVEKKQARESMPPASITGLPFVFMARGFDAAMGRTTIYGDAQYWDAIENFYSQVCEYCEGIAACIAKGDDAQAWQLASQCTRIDGAATMLAALSGDTTAAQALSKLGTDALHAKNREKKQTAFAWLDANPPPPRGKANAARYIAKHFFVTEDTGKEWVKEWEKKRGGVCP